MSFKVMEVGINRKPVCDFLLVILTDILSYHFGVIAAYCSNFGHCVLEPPTHLRLTGKRGVDFLFVLTELLC